MPENCSPSECPMEPRISALERANAQHGETHREIFRRLNDVERDNAVQDAHYKAIDAKLDELTIMVKELSGRAGKRWEGLVEKALWTVAAAVIAFVLGRVGL